MLLSEVAKHGCSRPTHAWHAVEDMKGGKAAPIWEIWGCRGWLQDKATRRDLMRATLSRCLSELD